MRKYRLTKITVKTREVVLMTNQTKETSCPLCHQALSVLIPSEKSPAAQPLNDQRAAEFFRAKVSGDRKFKGDL